MSDTPRTDAWKWTNDPIDELYGFARQLERELNAANERIKRMEEENDALRADLLLWSEKEAKP